MPTYTPGQGYGVGSGGPDGTYSQDDAARRQAESDAAADADFENFLNHGDTRKNLSPEQQAEQREERRQLFRTRNGLTGGNGVGGTSPNDPFINAPSADWGGPGGVDYYAGQAAAGGRENDAAQAANQGAMESSWSNLRNDRGPQAVENNVLAGRSANTRDQQIQALGLSRDAAMGKAPSEADFQTRIGMNDNMAQMSGQMGSARGLSALGGAQGTGAAALGQSSGNLAMAGGLARSKEIGDAIGMYGTQAGQVRTQDQSRLQQNTQNSMFNAKNNDDWKLGNANLLGQQGQLGNAQAGTDLAWMGEQQRGKDKQFQYDQEMAAEAAGADADAAGARIAKNREDKENKRQLINGGITAGLTIGGTALGGPAGGAAGGFAAKAAASGTKDWDW